MIKFSFSKQFISFLKRTIAIVGNNFISMQTQRLILKPFNKGYIADLFQLDQDPEVMRYITKGRPTTRDEIINDSLPRFTRYYQANTPLGYWALHLKSDDAFIGWCLLRPNLANSEEIEIGYRLKKVAWGQGYGTEASQYLLQQGFASGVVDQLMAIALVDNHSSIQIMQKLGLKFDHEFEEKDCPILRGERGVKYSLSKSAYLADGLSI